MHHSGGPGWRITMDTSGPMLVALYIRDVAGLVGLGHPALPPAEPRIHAADPHAVIAKLGGADALRTQWEYWWSILLEHHPAMMPELAPPAFPAFNGSPALQGVLRAHFGAALSWARAQQNDYGTLSRQRDIQGSYAVLQELVQDREMELGRNARDFTLTIVELPVSQPRAWFVEPDRMLMSRDLLDDQEIFRSFVQPVVELLV